MYRNTSSGYLFRMIHSIFCMALQKVVGELVRPKYMTVGLYSLKGVLNAAFHWSSSLI